MPWRFFAKRAMARAAFPELVAATSSGGGGGGGPGPGAVATTSPLAVAAFVMAVVGLCLGLPAFVLSVVNAARISRLRARLLDAVAGEATEREGGSRATSSSCPSCEKIRKIRRIVLDQEDDDGASPAPPKARHHQHHHQHPKVE